MSERLYSVEFKDLATIQLPNDFLARFANTYESNRQFQPGGPTAANQYLSSFLYQRKSNYRPNTELAQTLANSMGMGASNSMA
jgi:hypothetical protein